MRIDIVVNKWRNKEYEVEVKKECDNGDWVSIIETFTYEPSARRFVDMAILTGVKKGYDVYRHYADKISGENITMRMNDLVVQMG